MWDYNHARSSTLFLKITKIMHISHIHSASHLIFDNSIKISFTVLLVQCMPINPLLNHRHRKFSLRGPDNAHLSITSSASTEVVSAWMLSNANDVRRSSPIAKWRYVFKRFSVEKDHSAVVVVTGRVTSIWSRMATFGYSDASHAAKASLADFGQSSDTTVHRCFHSSNSAPSRLSSMNVWYVPVAGCKSPKEYLWMNPRINVDRQ